MNAEIKKFHKNQLGRDFIVGDLHGMFDMLQKQLREINFDKSKDRLFCCGDLIDRGNKSLECANLIYEPWFFSVRGNHEQMMIDVLVNDVNDGGLWLYNGGLWSLDEDKSDLTALAKDMDKMMPYQIELYGSIGIVHADVGNNWRELKKDHELACAIWDRTRISGRGVYSETVTGINRLYVGHTPTESKVVLGNVHYMDSGAVFGNSLRIEEILISEGVV